MKIFTRSLIKGGKKKLIFRIAKAWAKKRRNIDIVIYTRMRKDVFW